MKDIRWASSPWGFRETRFERHCQWLNDHGFRHVCGQFSATMPGLFSPNIIGDEIAKIKVAAGRYALGFASFNVDGDFTVRDDVDRQIALCRKQIDLAAAFEPEIIILFAGWQNRDDPEAYKQVGASLKAVARHAASHGLTVAMENHGGVTRTVEQCNRILGIADEPNLGLNYDPANFLMYGQDPLDALVRLEHPVVFTHFKSLKESSGGKQYCRVREGAIDYRPILEHLLTHYEGFFGIEYEEPIDVTQGSEDDLNTLRSLVGEIAGRECHPLNG